MKNRMWRGAFLGILTACMALQSCSVSYAASDGVSLYSLEEMLRISKEKESRVTGEDPEYIPDSRFIVADRIQNDIRVMSISGQCIETGAEQIFYAVGKNYVPEGSILPVLYGGGVEYSSTLEGRTSRQGNVYTLVRFAVKPMPDGGTENESGEFKEPEEDEKLWDLAAKDHWSLGDMVRCDIGGESLRFQCIDQDYYGNALFLCCRVIPSDTGSECRNEQLADGTHGYVFYPGPVASFGENSEYRESNIRKWLKDQEAAIPQALETNAGVTQAYTGRTGSGTCSQFDTSELKSYELGSQRLMDRLFLLSMDEAVRYRTYLWDVEDKSESAFSQNYWLRTPEYGGNKDSGRVYIVDLADGSIHSQPVTEPAGVRPVFVLPQKN